MMNERLTYCERIKTSILVIYVCFAVRLYFDKYFLCIWLNILFNTYGVLFNDWLRETIDVNWKILLSLDTQCMLTIRNENGFCKWTLHFRGGSAFSYNEENPYVLCAVRAAIIIIVIPVKCWENNPSLWDMWKTHGIHNDIVIILFA